MFLGLDISFDTMYMKYDDNSKRMKIYISLVSIVLLVVLFSYRPTL